MRTPGTASRPERRVSVFGAGRRLTPARPPTTCGPTSPRSPPYHDEGFSLHIGPARAGNLLEVGTVDAEDAAAVVVHALFARPNKIR